MTYETKLRDPLGHVLILTRVRERADGRWDGDVYVRGLHRAAVLAGGMQEANARTKAAAWDQLVEMQGRAWDT